MKFTKTRMEKAEEQLDVIWEKLGQAYDLAQEDNDYAGWLTFINGVQDTIEEYLEDLKHADDPDDEDEEAEPEDGDD
jgi:hypothetical protein